MLGGCVTAKSPGGALRRVLCVVGWCPRTSALRQVRPPRQARTAAHRAVSFQRRVWQGRPRTTPRHITVLSYSVVPCRVFSPHLDPQCRAAHVVSWRARCSTAPPWSSCSCCGLVLHRAVSCGSHFIYTTCTGCQLHTDTAVCRPVAF